MAMTTVSIKDYLEVMNRIATHGFIEQGIEEAVRVVMSSCWVIEKTGKRRPTEQEAGNLISKGTLN